MRLDLALRPILATTDPSVFVSLPASVGSITRPSSEVSLLLSLYSTSAAPTQVQMCERNPTLSWTLPLRYPYVIPTLSSAGTIYVWKEKFGGMDVSEAQRLRS